MNAQQNGRQLEVNQEDDNTEVDEGVRGRDQVSLLVQHEDDGGNQRSLGVAGNGRKVKKRVTNLEW